MESPQEQIQLLKLQKAVKNFLSEYHQMLARIYVVNGQVKGEPVYNYDIFAPLCIAVSESIALVLEFDENGNEKRIQVFSPNSSDAIKSYTLWDKTTPTEEAPSQKMAKALYEGLRDNYHRLFKELTQFPGPSSPESELARVNLMMKLGESIGHLPYEDKRHFEHIIISDQESATSSATIKTEMKRIKEELHIAEIKNQALDKTNARMAWLLPIGTALGLASFCVIQDRIVSSPTEVNSTSESKDLDHLVLPKDASDIEAILMISVPIYAGTDEIKDTLLENYITAKYLYGNKFLPMDWHKGTYNGEPTRFYDFTVPDSSHGESINGNEDQLNDTKWSDVFQTLLNGEEMSDDELIDYLIWWYSSNFESNTRTPLKLRKKDFRVERTQEGKISNIYYSGDVKYIGVNEIRNKKEIHPNSRRERNYKMTRSKPMTGKNGRLLFWVGRGQDLRVPKNFLRPAGTYHLDIEIEGQSNIMVNGSILAETIRHYLKARQKDLLTPEDIDYSLYINPNDLFTHFFLEEVISPDDSDCEKADKILAITRANTEYIWENGIEVERPFLLSLMMGGGDCNNQTIQLGQLSTVAGLDYAFVQSRTNQERLDAGEMKVGHLVGAFNLDQIGEDCVPSDANLHLESGKTWTIVEPQGSYAIGEYNHRELGQEITLFMPFNLVQD